MVGGRTGEDEESDMVEGIHTERWGYQRLDQRLLLPDAILVICWE
jgi:hypothetical protein